MRTTTLQRKIIYHMKRGAQLAIGLGTEISLSKPPSYKIIYWLKPATIESMLKKKLIKPCSIYMGHFRLNEKC